MLRYLLQFARPYRWKLVGCFFLLLLITGTTLIEPIIYKYLIDTLTTATTGNVNVPQVVSFLLFWAVTSLVGLVLFTLYRYSVDMIFLTAHRDFYIYAFDKVVRFDVRKHLERKSGEVIKKVDNASDALFWLLFDFSINFLPSWMSFLAIAVFSLFYHWPMALVSMSLIPIYIAIFAFGGIKTAKKQRESIDRYNEAIGRAYDAVANIQVVKSFAQEERELSLFQDLIDKATVFQKKVSQFWSLLGTAEFFLRILTRFVIFGGGIFFIYHGSLSIGAMIMFLAFSGYIYAPLQVLGSQIQGIQRHVIDVQKAKDMLEQIPEVLDYPYAKRYRVTKGEVIFDHVSFSYTTKHTLKDVSFTILPGKITAIVGHSGAGKSTIVNLLNRFYDAQEGDIRIDGRSVKKLTQLSLRQQIGMVMQDNTMFNDTIFNNVLYGNPHASQEDVYGAAKKANIHDFVLSLPEQYDTKVGERGLKLSGGEKQRVAIARVILKDPPILVLDEATSALDSETERQIQRALEKIMKNRTTIIIAHRLSTVRKAHQIIVLEKGVVTETGTHEELMKKRGGYHRMVDLQVSGFFK